MSDEDEGLPLAEAVRTYSDPQLWEAYQSARVKLHSIPPRPRWIDSSREQREAWLDRYERALPAAHADLNTAFQALAACFKPRLRRGELVATGTEWPVTMDSKPMVIPAHLWDVLVLDLDKGTVRAGGLLIVGVRVRPASERDADRGGLEPHTSEEAPRSERDTAVGSPGRPSVMSAIAQEMRRRAQRGELRDRITPECRALRAWAEQHVQGEHIPQVDSIRKALSDLYQSLREEINKEK